ncbi:MAG: hypothetical protein QOE71_2701 [Pseudonocardiales bacterium]|jgi:hypothetical protein|nr:hypothetical protein [Pseudonocardiales bacterium]MDQ1751645.1 hypothetical protein [Pseudonocardiales bacterium]
MTAQLSDWQWSVPTSTRLDRTLLDDRFTTRGRHRALEESPDDAIVLGPIAGVDELNERLVPGYRPRPERVMAPALVATKDPSRRIAVATGLARGVGESAPFAPIDAARNAAERESRPVEAQSRAKARSRRYRRAALTAAQPL